MLLTPRFTPRSGLAGLGLVLLAAALVGGVLCFFLLGEPHQGRGAQAAERGKHATRPAARDEAAPEDPRGAAPVELVPAGTPLVPVLQVAPVAAATPVVAGQETLALDAPGSAPLAMTAEPSGSKIEGPELKHLREGKAEVVNQRDMRRGRRSDRQERADEAAALGLPVEKRKVEPPKKNASREQVKKAPQKNEGPAKRQKPAPPEGEPKGN